MDETKQSKAFTTVPSAWSRKPPSADEIAEEEKQRKKQALEELQRLVLEQVRMNIPALYREFKLSTLNPSSVSLLSVERQQRVIDMLMAKQSDSYAFFGPAGTSKTTFCICLYRTAIVNVLRVYGNRASVDYYTGLKHPAMPYLWRITAKQMLDEHHKRETDRDAPLPTVRRGLINEAERFGVRPRLFLEEIDKIKGTDFKLNALFEVIDALYEQKGQLVINSNLTLTEFSNAFGADIARRIGEMCTVLDLF